MALASAALFGASTPLAKLLLGGGVDAWLLAGLLYLSSGIGLGVVHLARGLFGAPAAEAPLRRGDLPWLALVILAGGVVGPVLLMIGLAGTPVTAATLLLNLEGLATMVIAWVAFRENVDRRLLAGAAAILAGALLLSWRGGPGGVVGTLAKAVLTGHALGRDRAGPLQAGGHRLGQSADEAPRDAKRRHPDVDRAALLLGDGRIVVVQLDQGLDVF